MSELSCVSNLFTDQTLACSLSPHSVSVMRVSYRMFSWGGNSQVNQCVKHTAYRKVWRVCSPYLVFEVASGGPWGLVANEVPLILHWRVFAFVGRESSVPVF